MRGPSRSLLPAALLAALVSTASHAAPKDELEQTTRELEQSRQQRLDLDKKRESTGKELKTIQADSIVLASQIKRMESQLAEKEDAYRKVQSTLAAKQKAMDERKDDIAALLHAMIRMKRMPRNMVLAQPSSVPDILRTASALHVSYGGVQSDMHKLQGELQELATLRGKAETARAAVKKEQVALEIKQDVLTKTLAERETLLRGLNRDYDKLEARIATLSRTSQSLSELLANIEKEKAMFDTIGLPQAKPTAPERSQATVPASIPVASGGSFGAMKGRLPYPAAGTLLHRFGERKGKIDTFQGHVINTVAGAQVTAPHKGKVVFTGTFMDYGNMAIIEHGEGYHTLIAGLSAVRASLGQPVAAGEPIGAMGDAPGSRQLYLELRKHSKAIDPTPWMGNLSKGIATR